MAHHRFRKGRGGGNHNGNSNGIDMSGLIGCPVKPWIHENTARRYDSAEGSSSHFSQDWGSDATVTNVDDEYAYVKQYQRKEAEQVSKVMGAPNSGRPTTHRQEYVSRGHRARGRGGYVPRRGGRMTLDGSIQGSVEPPRQISNNPHYPPAPRVVPQTPADGSSKLAIYSVKDKIIAALKSHQVLIVEGFTGCGKTTQVPQFILDAEEGSNPKIIVTQPRRIAALSVANRVASERNWEIGRFVGYQVGMSRNYSDEAKLIYMTTGVLLQILINRKNLSEFSHIIIDEVHERDLDTDLLLLVIKKIMIDKGDMETKIILMSATLNVDKFLNYFPKWSTEKGELGAIAVQVPQASSFKVVEKYLNQFKLNDPESTSSENFYEEPKIHPLVYEAAVNIIANFDIMEREESREKGFKPSKEVLGESGYLSRGAVLVFLPGLLEIETMYKGLTEYSTQQSKDQDSPDLLKWSILPLHSTITTEEQQNVFRPVGKGYRKIILATNIAESSITVADIKYVIDFCLTKSLSCDPTTNYTCLRLEWASKNQCIQRKGRCGRVSDGYVYRMVPQTFYHGLVQEAAPEMEKSSLESVVLHVKTLNMGSPKALLATAIDPPKQSGIKRAVANLKEVAALTIDVINDKGERVSDEYDGELTYMGEVMAKLPIDMRFGRLIMIGYTFGLTEEAIIIAAGMSTKSPFSYPYHRRLQAYLSKLDWAKDSCSDCYALVNLYRSWKAKEKKGDFKQQHNKLNPATVWSKEYLVQYNVMHEIDQLIHEIKGRLKRMDIHIQEMHDDEMNEDQRMLLKVVVAGAFYPNYFYRARPKDSEYHRDIQKDLVGRSPFNAVAYQGFPSEQPGEVYVKHIVSQYECNLEYWPTIPYVEPESSKLVVTFDPRSHRVGLLCHGIYRAVKMRQLRHSVSFPIKGKHEALNLADRFKQLSLHSVSPRRCPPQVELPKITDRSINVRVIQVKDPTEFYVITEPNFDSYENLQKELSMLVPRLRVINNMTQKGDIVFVRDGQRVYRARVDVIVNNGFLVSFLDDGLVEFFSPKHLFTVSKDIAPLSYSTPALAIQCRLKAVKPASRYDCKWSEAAIGLMRSYLTKYETMTFNIFSIVESIMCGDVILPNNNKKSIAEFLLSEGYVELCKETKDSEENNSNRCSDYFSRQNASIIGSFDEKQVSKRIPLPLCDPPKMHPDEKPVTITLRGPSSPLEMSFTALCRSSHMKQVMVDGASVNSVALDQDYLEPCSRLLVSGSVGIAQRSGNVMARDTTLMPPIPGITALLTMMFCPELEFRVDDSKTKYTGILAGLGMDPATKEPVYGDHDVEIIFDTEILNEDVDEIDRIRLLMDSMLVERPQNLRNVQENLRALVLHLFTKKREPMEEIWPEHSHKWNCLDPDLRLLKGSALSELENPVFRQHGTVDFTSVGLQPAVNLVQLKSMNL